MSSVFTYSWKTKNTNIKKKAELIICMKLVNAYVNYVHIMFRISNVTKREISYNTCVLIVLI